MPMKRKFAKIDPLGSVAELLVALHLDGHLDGASLPDWASGTSVEEVFDAVRSLGDGQWLGDVYRDCGQQEASDRWLTTFLRGEPVPTRADAEVLSDDVSTSDAVEEYIREALTGRDATAFRKALKTKAFKDSAEAVAYCLSETVAASFIIPDAAFKTLKSRQRLLEPEIAADARLAAMIESVLSRAPANIYVDMAAAGIPGDATRGAKRLKAISAAVKKGSKA